LSFEGTLTMDEQNPQASSVEGSVQVSSVNTGLSIRDSNLRAGGFLGFFDVKRYPKMSFRSTRIGPMEGKNFKVYGDMTIKGASRPMVFDVVNKGELPAVQGKRRWAFGATITVLRKDFGLRWNPILEIGELFVRNVVKGNLEIQVVEE
jgi:polyisoprenoid-binding protein YceI